MKYGVQHMMVVITKRIPAMEKIMNKVRIMKIWPWVYNTFVRIQTFQDLSQAFGNSALLDEQCVHNVSYLSQCTIHGALIRDV